MWYAWRTSDAKTTDTLSLKKDLNVKLSIDVGEYTLRYVVTEKASGVFFESEIDLSVIDKYSKGVMALSRIEGDYSDITFINFTSNRKEQSWKPLQQTQVNGMNI